MATPYYGNRNFEDRRYEQEDRGRSSERDSGREDRGGWHEMQTEGGNTQRGQGFNPERGRWGGQGYGYEGQGYGRSGYGMRDDESRWGGQGQRGYGTGGEEHRWGSGRYGQGQSGDTMPDEGNRWGSSGIREGHGQRYGMRDEGRWGYGEGPRAHWDRGNLGGTGSYGGYGYGEARELAYGGEPWERQDERGPFQRMGDRIREGFRKMGRGPKGYKRSDERIQEEVCERIARSWINADDVEVKVKEGDVTFTGMVNSREEKRALEDLAEDVFGVREVNNNIRINRTQTTGTQSGTPGGGAARA